MIKHNHSTSNIELEESAKKLQIPFFRGVYSKNNIPSKPYLFESAIVNLDNGSGSHWIAYIKLISTIYYFDSFGNLRPTKELIKYFGSRAKLLYNYDRFQDWNSENCGQLCLRFLWEKTCGNAHL